MFTHIKRSGAGIANIMSKSVMQAVHISLVRGLAIPGAKEYIYISDLRQLLLSYVAEPSTSQKEWLGH